MLTFVFVSLTLLSYLAASGFAAKYSDESRAERCVVSGIVFFALLAIPVHALSWSSQLTVRNVAVLNAIAVFVVLAASTQGSLGSRIASVLSSALEPWRLFVGALERAWRERSIVGFGLLAFVGIVLWSVSVAYLAQSQSWDGRWYHESIVGFSLQYHGVRFPNLGTAFQHVMGYPKLAEGLQLWFAVFLDRRLIDVVPSLSVVLALTASYVLLRRFVEHSLQALGWSLSVALLPAVLLQLSSTLIDVTVFAFAASAMCFATRPVLRHMDLWVGALAMGMLGGAKATGLLLAAGYAFVLCARYVMRSDGQHWARRAVRCVLPMLVLIAIATPTYLKNLLEHHNPVWPLPYHSAALGLDLPGKRGAAPEHKPASVVIRDLLSPPKTNTEYADTRTNGYGNAMPYTVLPVALLAVCILCMGAFASLIRRRRLVDEVVLLWCMLLPSAVVLLASPAIWWARFHVHAVLVAVVLTAWLLRDAKWRAMSEALTGALLVSELVTFSWSNPGWNVDVAAAARLAALSADERATEPVSLVTQLPKALATRRETVLMPGDVVAYDVRYAFLANLWNDQFSNVLKRVQCEKPSSYLRKLRQANAFWAVMTDAPCLEVLRNHPQDWKELGHINTKTVLFERTSR